MNPILQITPDTSAAFTTTVVIAGIGIVVGMLLLLIAIFYAFGAVVSNAEKAAKKRQLNKLEKEMNTQTGTVQNSPSTEPFVEDGISGEVVAAISAAIATLGLKDAQIKSIKKKTEDSVDKTKSC